MVLRCAGQGKILFITILRSIPSYVAHVHLPGSVFLLPSAPMMTSNSSSLTGCVLGWTSALQPISARCLACVINQKCTRRASRRPLTGSSGRGVRWLSLCRACRCSLTFSLLIFWGFNKTLELDIDVDLDAQEESHFEQHQLELTNTCDMGKKEEMNYSANWGREPEQRLPSMYLLI